MTKNIAKHAFKSGMLPRVRRGVPFVKAEFEKIADEAVPTGFSDPQMVPKGSSANPPARLEKSAQYKIEHSAKEPASPKSNTEHQKYRDLSAQVRRMYLKQSLKSQEQDQHDLAARRQRLHEKAIAHRQKMDQVEDSEATKLTLPSIDQTLLIDGPLVQARSAEEKRQLNLKRKANLATTRLNQTKARDHTLLTIYQNARKYIINEQELDAEITAAFNSATPRTNTDYFAKLVGITSISSSSPAEYNRQLVENLTGTIGIKGKHTKNFKEYDYYPGLDEIQDVLERK